MMRVEKEKFKKLNPAEKKAFKVDKKLPGALTIDCKDLKAKEVCNILDLLIESVDK